MIVIGLADIHGNLAVIEQMTSILQSADVVLLAGDITHFGGSPEAEKVLKTVTRKVKKVFAVHGNCDYPSVASYLDVISADIHGKGVIHEGMGFVGLGGSLITPFQTPCEMTEDEIRHCLDQGAAFLPSGVPTVLVSHQPPLNTACDRLSSGQHVGSLAVREFIEKHQPLVCFTGHIHESAGVDRLGKTQIINPGMLPAGQYAYTVFVEESPAVEIRKL